MHENTGSTEPHAQIHYRRLAIGAAGPSRDPTAVKCNDVQELAVEIPQCKEGEFCLASFGGRNTIMSCQC